MASHPAKPLVIIPCDHRMVGAHPFHMVGEKYILAAALGAGTTPLLLPVLASPLDIGAIIALADGILLTGSPSNVAPHHYGGTAPRATTLLDERRDATALALIRAALEAGVPMLAICRGFQELNVALGGTLHQHLEEVPGRADHRSDSEAPVDVQYGPAHTVHVIAGSPLAAITGEDPFIVNSLHSQGIDRLAPGLAAAAHAEDGTIEAVSVTGAKKFALGVQWHPEWKYWESPVSRAILAAFGSACADRLKERTPAS
jgi:putative glutamine amidotransferase